MQLDSTGYNAPPAHLLIFSTGPDRQRYLGEGSATLQEIITRTALSSTYVGARPRPGLFVMSTRRSIPITGQILAQIWERRRTQAANRFEGPCHILIHRLATQTRCHNHCPPHQIQVGVHSTRVEWHPGLTKRLLRRHKVSFRTLPARCARRQF